MRFFLLTIALLLMAAALSTPLWVRHSPPTYELRPRSHKTVVAGRIKGDFSDSPWAGMVIYLGTERVTLHEDGKFSFVVLPGIHILKLCCSDRFQQVYREIEVEDRELYFELEAQPLLTISGRLVTPPQKPVNYVLNVSARLIGTNMVDRTFVASDGSFSFHLTEGDWRIELDNLEAGHTLHNITIDGVELHDQQLTISDVRGPSLPLQITLK
jgi:hypothetical protein